MYGISMEPWIKGFKETILHQAHGKKLSLIEWVRKKRIENDTSLYFL